MHRQSCYYNHDFGGNHGWSAFDCRRICIVCVVYLQLRSGYALYLFCDGWCHVFLRWNIRNCFTAESAINVQKGAVPVLGLCCSNFKSKARFGILTKIHRRGKGQEVKRFIKLSWTFFKFLCLGLTNNYALLWIQLDWQYASNGCRAKPRAVSLQFLFQDQIWKAYQKLHLDHSMDFLKKN